VGAALHFAKCFAGISRIFAIHVANKRVYNNWGLPLLKTHANGPHSVGDHAIANRPSGRSSVVEHDLAKVGVEGSNPFARSNLSLLTCALQL
jgi:hypothetical protein